MADLLTIPSLAAKIGFSLVLGSGPSNQTIETAAEGVSVNGSLAPLSWKRISMDK